MLFAECLSVFLSSGYSVNILRFLPYNFDQLLSDLGFDIFNYLYIVTLISREEVQCEFL